MSEDLARTKGLSAARSEGDGAVVLEAAHWLCLAAAPTFAIMAVASAVVGGGHADSLHCAAQHVSPDHRASPMNGMVLMYMLMSAFHSGPWLRVVSSRRLSDLRRRSEWCP